MERYLPNTTEVWQIVLWELYLCSGPMFKAGFQVFESQSRFRPTRDGRTSAERPFLNYYFASLRFAIQSSTADRGPTVKVCQND